MSDLMFEPSQLDSLMNNIALLTDSYKFTHWLQYPPGTEYVYSYFESRGGQYPEVAFFGLQYYLQKYLSKPVTQADIDIAEAFCNAHIGPGVFNKAGWQYIVDKHGGRLPVSIKAVPEGTIVPNKNVLMTIVNTDPKCFWLTNYLETLLVQVWSATTVCTRSRNMKKIITKFLKRNGDPKLIDFKLHDFGFRGASSVETAGTGGAAHLVNFMGTDTVVGAIVAMTAYGSKMPGFSIPAAEHSTITSWGRNAEGAAFKNMLDKYPEGLVAVVSDSYDIFSACKNLWGADLKKQVLGRKGTVVVRPDSGVPHEVVPQVLDILGEYYGYTTNIKGFKVLDPHIRVIQGDGIDETETEEILSAMEEHGWSADNVAFGMGGALLQQVNRDTQKFAFKCSSIKVKGEWQDVFKRPIGAPWKISKKGQLKLVPIADVGYVTVTSDTQNENLKAAADALVEVYRDGQITKRWTFDEVRARASI